MKLIDHFKTFLDECVNLNQSRIDQLTDSIEAVKKAIKDSAWEPKIIQFSPQGSWVHKTIIKPIPSKEYDADLMVFVELVDGWEAKDYINNLHAALAVNSTYKDKLRTYSHCVTIEYAGERRIDIAPVVRNRLLINQDEVCNKTSNKFEVSAPEAYTNWVVQKNSIAGGNDLRKVTRLLKYMRDIKSNFTCPSFLLTTLLGCRILDMDKGSADFIDTPTALKTLIGRLDDWLQANLTLPVVRNPVLHSEIQSTVWSEAQYSNFRDKINLYRGWIDEAYAEADRNESIGKWRRVFGDEFAPGETKEAASRISESTVATDSIIGVNTVSGQFKDLVDLVKQAGIKFIPEKLRHLPHIERPKWRPAGTNLSVKVSAQLLTGHNGSVMRAISSGDPLQPRYSLRFTASNPMGLPFSTNDYTIKWRVTNTGVAARAAGSLRGDYYSSESGSPMNRIEDLSYRGVHFVEAFLIRKADNKLAGQSDPFYVVIE